MDEVRICKRKLSCDRYSKRKFSTRISLMLSTCSILWTNTVFGKFPSLVFCSHLSAQNLGPKSRKNGTQSFTGPETAKSAIYNNYITHPHYLDCKTLAPPH